MTPIDKLAEEKFLAMNIVNQLFDEAKVDVAVRQSINDKCRNFVEKLILARESQMLAEIESLKEKIIDIKGCECKEPCHCNNDE